MPSKENAVITLTQRQQLGPDKSKRSYAATITTSENTPAGVQVLSTNEVQGRAVVRLEIDDPLNSPKFEFFLDGQSPASVNFEKIDSRIAEFFLTSAPQIEIEENEAWTEHTKAATRSPNRLRIRPAQEGRMWNKREQDLTRADEPVELTELDRENALEDEISLSLGKVTRYTYPGQSKSDTINVEVFNPFTNSAETQLQISRQFRYKRMASEPMSPHNSTDITVLAPTKIKTTGTAYTIIQTIFFTSDQFELLITVEDLKTHRKVSRVLTSTEIGEPVIYSSEDDHKKITSPAA